MKQILATFVLSTLVAVEAAPAVEACAQCHAAVSAAHAVSVHGHPSRSVACASCHGGSAAHLAEPRSGNIFDPRRAEAAQADATCLGCHTATVRTGRWKSNVHSRAGLSCVSCHQLHPAQTGGAGNVAPPVRALLRQSSESETCYECHRDVRRAQLQRSTHILPDDHRQARMQCSACHDSHGSSPKMIRGPRVNALCETCHDEKRGPFLWEHSPVRDDCLSCHAHHGSNNVNLLTMRVPMLCQSCHAGDPHQTIAASSSSAWMTNRGCLNCHQMIHGSNHPSGITLLR